MAQHEHFPAQSRVCRFVGTAKAVAREDGVKLGDYWPSVVAEEGMSAHSRTITASPPAQKTSPANAVSPRSF